MYRVGEFEYSSGDLLGHGAFALVFKGRRVKDHQPVAIKCIKTKNNKFSSIQQKEIEILKDLRHPNIVQLFDYLDSGSDVFLVMEYCNGGDMGDYLSAKKTLSEDSIHVLAKHIAGALEALQSHQIIHRDIKPQNLLLSYPVIGGIKKDKAFRDVTVKLADFGFARHLSPTAMAATLCGSPLYMAPEILLGRRYDTKADLWSVGTILYQCLAGVAPFLADNVQILRKRYQRETLSPKIPSGTSHHLSQLLISLLRKEPRERLSYENFFAHPFLKDATPDPAPVLSQHVKSSPVPIQRHTQQQCTRQSPRRGSSVDKYSLSPSSASGPPLSHQIGSQGSMPHLSAQSPRSDVTDQGFILVDLPGSSGPRRYNRSNSYSLSTSPGSGHTPSSTHTPSSLGSLTRYNSLTTPFYQTRPSPNEIPSSAGTTPTNVNVSSGYYSRTQGGSPNSLSRSNSGRKSGPVPFGQLIPQPFVCAHSPHHHSLTNSPSPLSTPPSSLASNQNRAGTRQGLPRPGSTGRLRALTEEKVRPQPKKRQGEKVYEISHSCLLVSDEEAGDSPSDDEQFPLGLNMSMTSNQSMEDQDEPRPPSATERAQSRRRSFANHDQTDSGKISIVDTDEVRFSARGGIRRGRSSSFTHRDVKLSHDLAALHTRAESLQANKPTAVGARLDRGGSPKIDSFHLPFLFPSSADDCGGRNSGDSHDCGRRVTGDSRECGRRVSGDPRELQGRDGSAGESSCVRGLRESLVLGRECVAMAQARQSPIMLLSTSTNLNDSGVGSRGQRCSEQLVLYAKAVSVLSSSLVVYELNSASRNTDPSPQHRDVEGEVRALLALCLDKAQTVREQLSEYNVTVKCISQVSAEKLLYLEALDMCKAAVLDEKSGEAKECIKRYRRAKLIFEHLLFSAKSQRDGTLLQKYVTTCEKRVAHLSTRSH